MSLNQDVRNYEENKKSIEKINRDLEFKLSDVESKNSILDSKTLKKTSIEKMVGRLEKLNEKSELTDTEQQEYDELLNGESYENKLKEFKDDKKKLEKDIKNIQEEIAEMKKDLNEIKKDLAEKKQDYNEALKNIANRSPEYSKNVLNVMKEKAEQKKQEKDKEDITNKSILDVVNEDRNKCLKSDLNILVTKKKEIDELQKIKDRESEIDSDIEKYKEEISKIKDGRDFFSKEEYEKIESLEKKIKELEGEKVKIVDFDSKKEDLEQSVLQFSSDTRLYTGKTFEPSEIENFIGLEHEKTEDGKEWNLTKGVEKRKENNDKEREVYQKQIDKIDSKINGINIDTTNIDNLNSEISGLENENRNLENLINQGNYLQPDPANPGQILVTDEMSDDVRRQIEALNLHTQEKIDSGLFKIKNGKLDFEGTDMGTVETGILKKFRSWVNKIGMDRADNGKKTFGFNDKKYTEQKTYNQNKESINEKIKQELIIKKTRNATEIAGKTEERDNKQTEEQNKATENFDKVFDKFKNTGNRDQVFQEYMDMEDEGR